MTDKEVPVTAAERAAAAKKVEPTEKVEAVNPKEDGKKDDKETKKEAPVEEKRKPAVLSPEEMEPVHRIAENLAKGLTYVVRNFRITYDFKLSNGETKTIGWNEGDEIVDDGKTFSMPHNSFLSLASDGHIEVKKQQKEE